MAILLIAFDLTDPTAETHLTEAIRRAGLRWARPLPSVWCLETEKTASEIENELAGWLGLDDGLMVQEVKGNAALSNTIIRWTPSQTAERAEPGSNVLRLPVNAAKVAEAA